MIELLIALVGVLNIAVGALALQVRRNGKSDGKNNTALHDAVKLLYSVDGKLEKLVANQERNAKEETDWHGEVRANYKDIIKELGNIPKRGEQ